MMHFSRFRAGLPVVITWWLTGCGGANVVVDADFPSPLVDPLPLEVGVHYSEDFVNYRYEEQTKGKGKFSLDTGASQVVLFDTLLGGFFQGTVKIKTLPAGESYAHLDAVIVPEIEEIQFTLPRDTNTRLFEVWFKFKMSLYTPEGKLITSWPLPAYGKTPTGFMKSQEEALEQAAIVALRDAGANFAIKFNRLPELRRWLDDRLAAADVPNTSVETTDED